MNILMLDEFWKSIASEEADLEEYFASFVSDHDLDESEIEALRTGIFEVLATRFADFVEEVSSEIQDAQLASMFEYFCQSWNLEDDTADCLALAIAEATKRWFDEEAEDENGTFSSSDEEGFDEEKDQDEAADEEDRSAADEEMIRAFLKKLTSTKPDPSKDYFDVIDSVGEDPYGNDFGKGVKVFDRKAHRYGHGPNEENELRGSTSAARTLRPKSQEFDDEHFVYGLSCKHEATEAAREHAASKAYNMKYVGQNDTFHHFTFQQPEHRDLVQKHLTKLFGLTSTKVFKVQKPYDEGLKIESNLHEGLNRNLNSHSTLVRDSLKHMRRTNKPSSYTNEAIASTKNHISASKNIVLDDHELKYDANYLGILNRV
jgi:hypothetical protein